jgi:DNA polymerase III subunit gamma/tau
VARTKPKGEAASPPTSSAEPTTSPPVPTPANTHYTVVARRYRPQHFDDVVGQDHVVESLRNAIRMNRVTHAYLFSGTRGVGKTSIARIFAKCLNCVHGPSDSPDQTCDICRAIADGQDVDVIEIDGASNNGVEQVRELRQNAGLRPSRARYKIYYIDEVHMLSTAAFNALLKTLEEPPPHVKFFFATTEPNKIPITVLSRCQRYDFASISLELLVKTLAKICDAEGVAADEEALQVLARRAGGSMRDAESLLEQLLSGGGKKLTSESVHRALGIAPDDRVLDLLDALAGHNLASALEELDRAVNQGVQPVDVLNSSLEFLRDVMITKVGAHVSALAAAPAQRPRVELIAGRLSLDTVLAGIQILEQARGRLRGSPHARLIVETALAKVARLEDLVELGALIARVSALEGVPAGSAPPAPVKKKLIPSNGSPVVAESPSRIELPPAPPLSPVELEPRPAPAIAPAPAPEGPRPLDQVPLPTLWKTLLTRLGEPLRTNLKWVKATTIEPPGVLVLHIPDGYNWIADSCDTAESRARIETALKELVTPPITIRFERPETAGEPPPPLAASPIDDLSADPLVRRLVELFEARPVHVESDDRG